MGVYILCCYPVLFIKVIFNPHIFRIKPNPKFSGALTEDFLLFSLNGNLFYYNLFQLLQNIYIGNLLNALHVGSFYFR